MSTEDRDRELVLQVVRGDRPWRDLERVGLTVSFMDDGCDCEGVGTVVAIPSVTDVATGLRKMIDGRELDLRRWASVVLAASAAIDLVQLEEEAEGEQILESLWKASAGNTLDEEALALARRLANADQGRR